MQQLPEAIQAMFFQVFNDEITIEEFEEWLYNNRELEKLLGEGLYIDLVSVNYKEPHGRYEMQKLIDHFLDWAKFEERKLRQILNELQKDNAEFINALLKSYDLYCDGYRFMEDIGMGYGLGFGANYGFHLREGTLTQNELKYIEKFRNNIAAKASEVLALLDSQKIIIKPKNKEVDERLIRYDYKDDRTPEELTREVIKKVEWQEAQNSFYKRVKRFFGG